MHTWLSRFANIHGANADRQQLHDFIWSMFDRPPGSKAPFQFRVEADHILVRSVEKPAWPSPVFDVIEEAHPWVNGDFVQLDMHLTPYRRGTRGDSRVELPMTREHEVEYVTRRLAQMGFTPAMRYEEDEPVLDMYLTPFRANPLNRKNVPLNPKHLRALGTVTDVVLLHRAFEGGCGGKKQFLGFGMPLLWPIDMVL